MLTIEEARAIILAEVPPPRAAELPLAEAQGAVLAEEVRSDLDMPPFEKAMMDGYAVRAADTGPYRLVEEIPAGRVPTREIGPGECAKIMTGAPLPRGADAVQQVEKTRRDGERVSFLEPVRPRQNVAARGEDLRDGDVVLSPGRPLGAAELGALAAVGRTRVKVWARPRVAVLATGDELVPPERRPGPGKIRNSNSAMIAAQVRAMGLPCDDLYADDLAPLRAAGRRIAEVSALAIDERWRDVGLLVVRNLVQMIALYADGLARLDTLCIAVNPRHARFYESCLRFERFGELKSYPAVNNAPAVALRLDLAREMRAAQPASAVPFAAGLLEPAETGAVVATLRRDIARMQSFQSLPGNLSTETAV